MVILPIRKISDELPLLRLEKIVNAMELPIGRLHTNANANRACQEAQGADVIIKSLMIDSWKYSTL